MNEVIFGGTWNSARGEVTGYDAIFTDDRIRAINIDTALALVNDELVIDAFSVTVECHTFDAELFAPRDYDAIQTNNVPDTLFGTNAPVSNDIAVMAYGMPVWYMADGILEGKFFLQSITRVNKIVYQISCVSAMGILDSRVHLGGVYTGTIGGDTVGALIDDIMQDGGTNIVDYSVDNDVATTYVYGWLPVATKRQNLHQLLFAYNISIIKDTDGSVRFCYLDEQVVTPIPDNRIFLNGTVQLAEAVSAIELTEHNYVASPSDPVVTLFDNSDGYSGTTANTLIYFEQAPAHSLAASGGLTIDSYGDNWARVTGVGVLTGKLYTHIAQVRTARTEGTPLMDNPRTVADATLVTPINSENVMKRLLAYYSARRIVTADVVLDTEKCGDQVSFTNPYGQSDAGYITHMSTSVTSIRKARTEIVTGYVTQGWGNYYSQSIVLTGSGTWTVPNDAPETIHVIIVGGGSGGDGGMKGADGGTGSGSPRAYGTNGAGGTGGAPGEGGKVLTLDLTVNHGDTFSYSCGTGGAGGTRHGGVGGAGTATTFDNYSSNSGSLLHTGVVDMLNGVVYGKDGRLGYDGAAGNQQLTAGNSSWPAGLDGGRSNVDIGGGMTIPAYGGYGGGAAYGHKGYDGNQGSGGDGADASAPAAASYGNGGDGGNGGGGGGGGGYIYYSGWSGVVGGDGGNGSNGARGGDGAVVIYY